MYYIVDLIDCLKYSTYLVLYIHEKNQQIFGTAECTRGTGSLRLSTYSETKLVSYQVGWFDLVNMVSNAFSKSNNYKCLPSVGLFYGQFILVPQVRDKKTKIKVYTYIFIRLCTEDMLENPELYEMFILGI